MANPNQPPSFKTNVHRAPTKKWADAKSYSYAGDDWGGYDEYDEYGSYDEPPPPVKPTGLRQRGQDLASSSTQSRYYNQAQPAQPSLQIPTPKLDRLSYAVGDDSQGLYSQPSTEPSAWDPSKPSLPGRQPQSQRVETTEQGRLPATTFSDMSRRYEPEQSNQSRTELSSAPQMSVSEDQGFGHGDFTSDSVPPHPANHGMSSLPSDLRDLRDFQPSAVPQPLVSRAAPSLAALDATSSPDQTQSGRFPPRKSSLKSQSRPELPRVSQQESSEGNSTPRSDEDIPELTAHAFIRPADIYRRMQEERSRASQRQSLDSDHSSAESAQPDSHNGVRLNTTAQEAESGSYLRQKPSLEPVAERQSEYGMESTANDASGTLQVPGVSLTSEGSGNREEYLPQLGRMSGFSSFGSELWDLGSDKEGLTSSQAKNQTASYRSDGSAAQTSRPRQNILAAVNTAFDSRNDNTVLDTPASSDPVSNESGSVSRSNTDSTAGISPIMSTRRGPNIRDREPDFSSPPTIAEEVHRSNPQKARRPSGETLRDLKPASAASTSEAVAGIPENYRRHSPGHSLEIETSIKQPESEEGSVVQTPNTRSDEPSSATPASSALEDYEKTRFSHYETREADLAAAVNSSPDQEVPGVATAAIDARNGFLRRSVNQQDDEHPSVDATDGVMPSHRASSGSPVNPQSDNFTKTASLDHTQANTSKFDPLIPRPGLPGEWVSYSTIDNDGEEEDLQANDDSDEDDYNSIVATPKGMRAQSPGPDSSAEIDLAPNKGSLEGSSYINRPDPSTLVALAAAGGAIASSLAASSNVSKDTHVTDNSRYGASNIESNYVPPYISSVDEKGNLPDTPESAGPTPPAKDKVSSDHTFGYFHSVDSNTPAISQTGPAEGIESTDETVASPSSDWSSPEDTENDKLSREIVRSLTPQAPNNLNVVTTSGDITNNKLGVPDSPSAESMRASTLIPREYDSYWASGGAIEGGSPGLVSKEHLIGTDTPEILEQQHKHLGQNHAPRSESNMLRKRFSWETEETVGNSEDGAVEQLKNPSGTGLGLDTNIPATAERLSSPTTPKTTTYEPLNELPLGRSRALSDVTKEFAGESPVARNRGLSDVTKEFAGDSNINEQGKALHQRLMSSSAPPTQNLRPMSQPKGLPFREIMAMKNSVDRTQVFKATREEFASMHTGLSDWLNYMLTANPEHLQGSLIPAIETNEVGGSARGKNLSAPGRPGTAGPSALMPQPYYMQYLDSAAQIQSGGSTQSPVEASPSGSNFFGKGRSSSSQMQAKGKDMLHSAGVFSGKAASGAKGLFNKGRNRFKAATQDKGGEQ